MIILKQNLLKILIFLFFFIETNSISGDDVVDLLLDTSITIKAGNTFGSGVIFSSKDSQNKTFNLIWAAAHVVIGARTTNVAILNNVTNVIYTFDKIDVLKIIRKDQKPIGRFELIAHVIKFSDPIAGHDLALLKLDSDESYKSLKFLLDKDYPKLGSEIYFMGSFPGSPNTLTKGIYSGYDRRIFNFRYDLVDGLTFPGGSGGAVFLVSNGLCVGLATRIDQNLTVIVPSRRIVDYCKQKNIEWAVNSDVKLGSVEDMKNIGIE